jgi:hypothetical protein
MERQSFISERPKKVYYFIHSQSHAAPCFHHLQLLPWLKRRHFFLSVLIYNQNIKQDREIQAHIEKIQDSAQAGDARNGHILYIKDFGSSGHRSIEFNDEGDRIRMLYRVHSYLRGIRE